MLPPHLRKFADFYNSYGLGAVKNLWLLTCLLPVARTVNLYKLKDYVGGLLKNTETDPLSHYRRLTRFFDDWGRDKAFLHDIMRQNLRLLKKFGFKTLVMDGTSWKLGETDVHYLVLSVLVGNVAVPIFWTQLDKAGASSQAERQAMFEEALALFDLGGMTLLGDREYVGKAWFKFLKDNKLHFVIRLRLGDYVEDVDSAKGNGYYRMYQKCAAKDKLYHKLVWLDGIPYKIVMMANPKHDAKEPVFIFLTTLPDAKKAAQSYVKRWKIECLFFHVKTNGFNLEDLNLRDPGKNSLMLAIVATSYILAIREGLKRADAIAKNKYVDGSEWPEESIFRKGLSWLTSKCNHFIQFLTYVLAALSPKNHALFKNVQ